MTIAPAKRSSDHGGESGKGNEDDFDALVITKVQKINKDTGTGEPAEKRLKTGNGIGAGQLFSSSTGEVNTIFTYYRMTSN